MAAQYKTRCPHCGAQFKISEEHLKQAGGKVRCGSCLEIFQATEHLVREQPARPAAKKAAPAAPKKKPAAPAQKSKQPPARPEQPQDRWAMPSEEEEPSWTPPGGDKAAPDSTEDSGKEELIPQNDTSLSLGSSELSDSFTSFDSDDADGTDDDFDMDGGHHGDGSDESWAEELLQELEGGDESGEEEAPAEVDASNMSLLDEVGIGEEADEAPARDDAGDTAGEPEEDDLNFFSDSFGMLEEGEAELESIEITEEPGPSARLKKAVPTGPGKRDWLKWGSLSLAALMILAVQYLMFNFDSLARTPAWRPFYAGICNTVGCHLPNPSDVSQLRGTNLVVRNDPVAANGLIVDAILFNEASYAQPFPVLELTFSDLDGNPVASRRFTPDEYLRGDLKSLSSMPPGKPIHVSFAIVDPGKQAVNYSLRFFPAPAPGTSG